MKRLWERRFFSQNNQIEKFINKVADLKSACESDTNIIKVSLLDKKHHIYFRRQEIKTSQEVAY